MEAGHHTLREMHNIGGVEAEIVVGLEGGDGVVVVGGTGHDVPRYDGIVSVLDGEDALSEDLEKSLVLYGSGREVAFGAIEVESGSLSAGDGEGCDFAGADETLA